jgi:hypothetical protein
VFAPGDRQHPVVARFLTHATDPPVGKPDGWMVPVENLKENLQPTDRHVPTLHVDQLMKD